MWANEHLKVAEANIKGKLSTFEKSLTRMGKHEKLYFVKLSSMEVLHKQHFCVRNLHTIHHIHLLRVLAYRSPELL